MTHIIFCLILTLIASIRISDQKALDDYISHYEEVHYDRTDLHQRHLRAKRSAGNPSLDLKFKAFGKKFDLKLRSDLSSIFSLTHEHTHLNGTKDYFDLSHIYDGQVSGIPDSQVHGAVIGGIFRGHIHIPGDATYHIEPSRRFFDDRQPFHSVIYDEKHMNLDPYRAKREAERKEKRSSSCGYDRNLEWMQAVSESAIHSTSRERRSESPKEKYVHQAHKYSEQWNREKRAVGGTGKTCYLYLQSDPKFYKYALADNDNNPNLARESIFAFFSSHLKQLNNIYENTEFELYDHATNPSSPRFNGIRFLVQRTTIMTDESLQCASLNPSQFCHPNIDVSNFLNLNSLTNHDDFCLAYVFTHRDFMQGTLGLAWVGSPTKAAGGICEKWKEYPQGSSGARVEKSLNTGIVTIINYGKVVPAKVSQLTFAHEVGHNFGSPHDTGSVCAPFGTTQAGADLGNFIMFASATMGDKPHNSKFSSCSLDNITLVLDAVLNGKDKKINCFKASDGAFCGNGLTEADEECDCGYISDCNDKCCNGRNAGGQGCTRTSSAACSPSQGPCCTTECQFIGTVTNRTCSSEDECSEASYCTDNLATCPESEQKRNGTLCNGKSQICKGGECIGSLCESISGWEECFLTATKKSSGDEKKELCYLACKKSGSSNCISSKNTVELNKDENLELKVLLAGVGHAQGFQLPAGSPCNNFQGYCDGFHKCRGVDAEGPLARLKNLIFNPQTLETIKDWIVEHWWAVLLMALGLVVFMGLFIKFCSVHTPSTNPRKKAARKLSQTFTLRRRPPHHRGHQNPDQPLRQAQGPTGSQGPPPPYSGPSVGGGPPHGRGPRYDVDRQAGKGKQKGNKQQKTDMNRI